MRRNPRVTWSLALAFGTTIVLGLSVACSPRGPRLAERLRREGGSIVCGIDDDARTIDQLTLRKNADEALRMLTAQYTIRCLNVRGSDVTASALAEFLATQAAGVVGLSSTVSLLPVDRAATFSALSTLEWLSLWGDIGLGNLDSLRACSRLRALYFQQESRDPPLGLSFLRELPDLQTLWVGPAADATEAIASCPNLRVLQLNAAGANHDVMETIAALPELRRLVLTGEAPITADTLAPLAHAPHLTDLTLSGLPIGDDALPVLARCRGLEELWLDNTRISSVRPLRDLPRLRRLFVHHTSVDQEDVRDLAGSETITCLIGDFMLEDPKQIFPAWTGRELVGDVEPLDSIWRDVLRLRKAADNAR